MSDLTDEQLEVKIAEAIGTQPYVKMSKKGMQNLILLIRTLEQGTDIEKDIDLLDTQSE